MDIQLHQSIFDFSESEWQLLNIDTPFNSYAFLAALEKSQSIGGETGWQPCYLGARINGELLAVLIAYQKQHSSGEYVFDWTWADAYHSYGKNYYPKLTTSIPFTPVPCEKFLTVRPLSSIQQQQCIDYVKSFCLQEGFSSWHWLFSTTSINDDTMVKRHSVQFHWFNRNFSSFDDFLALFSAKKRKNVRQERKKVQASGLDIYILEGDQISVEDWQEFYACYQITYLKRGHQGYLTLDFFLQIQQTMANNLVLIAAKNGEDFIAGALFFKDSDNLYGRYWGSLQPIDNLHFELCYYQGIEYAIRHGIKKFNPGTQGEHKIARGFEPVTLQSYHWLADDFLKGPIEDFCRREIQHLEAHAKECRSSLPFKQ
jgi:uncharacterized protein